MDTLKCACGKVYRVADGQAGRRFKCKACGAVLVVPTPGHTAEPETASAVHARPVSAKPTCPSCGQPLEPGAKLCTQCGFVLATGKRLASQTATETTPTTFATTPPADAGDTADRKGWLVSRGELIRNVGLLGVLVLVGVGLTVWRMRVRARKRVEALVTESIKGSNLRRMIKEAPVPLATLVRYCTEPGTVPSEHKRRDKGLANIIRYLPKDTDFAPLTSLSTAFERARPRAIEAVARRATIGWLSTIATPGGPVEHAFAADVLKQLLPVGDIDGEDVAQAVRGEGLKAVVCRRCRNVLAGDYALKITTVWSTERLERSRPVRSEQTQTCRTLSPVISVDCQDHEWTAKLFGEHWQGTTDNLSTCKVVCPIPATCQPIRELNHLGDSTRAELVLTIDTSGLTVTAVSFPAFRPGDIKTWSGDYYSQRPDGKSLLGYRLIAQQTSTRRTRQGGVDPSKSKYTKVYYKQGFPGFSGFKCELLKSQ